MIKEELTKLGALENCEADPEIEQFVIPDDQCLETKMVKMEMTGEGKPNRSSKRDRNNEIEE
jgi:hypothetical protein